MRRVVDIYYTVPDFCDPVSLGRRKNRTTNGVSTNFLYDGLDIVLDRGSDGSISEYLNALNVDEKLRQSSAATGNLYFLQDHLGSTLAVTNSNGVVAEQTRYEAFGGSSNSSLTRYGYTGRERDGLTGLIYYRARWYDPEQGRFLSEDPAGFAGGLNLYAYVNNNPLSFIDPTGRQGEAVAAAGTLAGVGAFSGAGTGAGAAIAAGTAAAAPWLAAGAAVGALWYGAWKFGEWTAQQPWNPLTHPANPPYNPPIPGRPARPVPPPPPMEMAKGRESGRNWATEQAKATAQGLKKDVCEVYEKSTLQRTRQDCRFRTD